MTGRASALVAGLAIDALLGDPRRWHPVAGFGRVAAVLERRCWVDRRDAGVAYSVVLAGGATIAAAVVDRSLYRRPAARWAFAVATVWATLGGRSLAGEAERLAGLVAGGDIDEARRRIPALVGRDPAALDGPGLCRAAAESVAENTGDGVVGPILWGALLGPAGAAGYRAANTLDAMVGHRTARHARFGWASARLDDALNWPVARAGALLACMLAPAVGGDRRAAFAVLRRDGARHPSPNAGRLEASFAGALGVTLGGPLNYGGRCEHRPLLGHGPPPRPGDVRRAVTLSRLVGLAATLLAAAAVGRLR